MSTSSPTPQPQSADTRLQTANSAEPLVDIRGVTKLFGKLRALDNFTMSIRPGETYGLIGPNGSGKTTLIRAIVGLTRPTAGEVRILGQRMPNRQIAKEIGYMTQNNALYQELTIRENLEFFGRIYGLRGKPLQQRVSAVLETVDLAERGRSIVDTLSGGMKQRVLLASALIHQPRLLLLDEPTVGIDPELRLSFWDHFARLNAQGVTIIVSTHHLDEAARCTRLGLMRFGVLLAEGKPDELTTLSGKATMEEAFLYFATRHKDQA
ncbi:MAG TPA: ABC transporter ATP-binding protein [Ktedonobacterales bacterium]|nr:ABC transporter ATP-binding protein [Ktedonobacterales bacterium]